MIRIRTILILISLGTNVFIGVNTSAQSMLGARGVALGNATTAVYDYNWSVFTNPAMLNSDGLELGFYGLRNYGFSELTDISAFVTSSTKYGTLAAGIHRYGDDLFSESRYRVGYKNEWELLHFGVVLNYNYISFASPYGAGGALGVDIGVAAELGENMWIGAKSSNINQPSYSFAVEDEDLFRDLSLGFSYELYEKALFAFDVVKDVRFPVSYRSGLEVEVIENLMGRVGVTTEPVTYSFGLGYSKDLWEVNLAVQQHSLLGTSPGFDLLFNF